MIRPVVWQKESGNRLFLLLFCVFGFVLGILVFTFFKELLSSSLSPDLTSAFDSDSPFSTLISCFATELKYSLCLYMFGFCLFANAGCFCLLAYKSALIGFSATYLLSGAYPLSYYFIHILSSLAGLIFLCCIGALSSDFSSCRIGTSKAPKGRDIANYSVKCLFYTGAIFISVLIRHILLNII